MSGPRPRFDPSEIRASDAPDVSDAELADALAVARELEALAAGVGIRATEGFDDRVMAAIAAEPAPRLVIRSATTVRGGRPAVFLLALRDAWALATTGGRPMAVRAQGLAFVLVVVVALGSLAAAGAVTVGGMLNWPSSPTPSLEPGPTLAPTPTDPAEATPSPSSTSPAEPTGSPEASDTAQPTETARSTATAKPDPTTTPTGTAKPGQTPRPTRTPRATETPEPTEPTQTPDPTHGGDGPSSDGPG